MHHQSGFLPELTAKIQIKFVKWLPIIKKMVKKKEEETKKHGICRFLCNFAGNINIASAMDKEKEVLTRNTDSDYERLKVWKDNPKLDDYLSEKHWNHQVNELLYAYLKSRYSGNEVGVYINMGLLSYQEGQDYNQIYGVMFNEAYCFCSYVLTTPVPYTKIAFLERKAKTLCSIESAAPLISYNILVMTGLILCFANDHNDDVGRFLNYLSIHNSTHCFGDKFHHFEDYCKIGLICVAGIMADGQLQPPGKLRPGYDYKSRDEYLRKTIIEYKCIAEEMEKNRKETNTRKQEEKMAMDDKFNDILNKLAEQTEIIRRIEHHSNVAHHQQRRSDSWESIMRYVDVPISIPNRNEDETGNKKTGAPKKPFRNFVVGKDEEEKNKVMEIIRNNIISNDAKQSALLICAAIEAGKLLCHVSAPSIKREYYVNANSIKPYLTKFKSAKEGKNPSPFTETELAPYKSLFN